MRSFLLVLVVDVVVVAAGLLLWRPAAEPGGSRGDDATAIDASRVLEETRSLRAEVERLRASLPPPGGRTARADAPPPPAPPGGHARPNDAPRAGTTIPDQDLDRLESALKAVQLREARALAAKTLVQAVGYVFPDLSPEQRRGVAEAVGAYRDQITRAMQPGGDGPEAGYQAAVAALRENLSRLVPSARAEEVIRHYAIKPGPPAHAPAVSPPMPAPR